MLIAVGITHFEDVVVVTILAFIEREIIVGMGKAFRFDGLIHRHG